uniref:Secreted SPRY domain-containing protein 4 n=1 Tax=Globodera rostochiensis TaxID=31243 RepID=A0A914IDN1_GLORO
MRTILFLGSGCLIVASILLETESDASPPKTLPSNTNTEQNQWDADTCNKGLTLSVSTLSEPEQLPGSRLIVKYNEYNYESRSVRAEQPITKSKSDMFYYEVKILALALTGIISIGVGPKQMPLNKEIGMLKGTYAYGSGRKAFIWGHELAGCRHANGRPYIFEGIPEFRADDVIGCGVNLKNRKIFYTKNGVLLETPVLLVDSVAGLFPWVTLYWIGDAIKANFGPNFVYKFA